MRESQTPLLEHVALIFNYLGRGVGRALVLVTIGILLIAAKRWWALLAFAITEALTPLLSSAAKAVIDRPRPPDGLVHPTSAAFPSGHAAFAGATCIAAVLLFTKIDRRRLPWWALAAAGIAGMATEPHLPSGALVARRDRWFPPRRRRRRSCLRSPPTLAPSARRARTVITASAARGCQARGARVDGCRGTFFANICSCRRRFSTPTRTRSSRRSSSGTTRGCAGSPVIVGGGVVLAASYEAKAYGVRTAMGGRQALRIHPNGLNRRQVLVTSSFAWLPARRG